MGHMCSTAIAIGDLERYPYHVARSFSITKICGRVLGDFFFFSSFECH